MVQSSRIEIELAIKDLATAEVQQFTRSLQQSGQKIERSQKGAAKEIDDTTKSIKRLAKEAKDAERDFRPLNARLAESKREATLGRRQVSGLADGYRGLSGAIRAVPALAAGVGLTAAVKAGAEFSTAFAEVATIAGATDEELESLRSSVLELSIELGKSPTDVANALYQTISSGATDAAEAVGLLEEGLKLSVAGLSDPTASIDGLTTIVNAYGLEIGKADDVSDAFFRTVQLGKTRVEELSNSIGQVAPLASQLGVSYQELLAALAALTQQGLSTSEAFTQIRSVLIGLVKNGDDVDVALRKIGKSFGDGEIRSRGFQSVLNDVRASVGDSESALTALFGRAEAVGGVLGLTGDNAARFASTLDSVTDSAGATDVAFQTIEGASGRRLQKFISNLKTSFVELGASILDAGVELVDFLNQDLDQSATKATSERARIVEQILAGERSITEQVNIVGLRSTALNQATEQLVENLRAAGVEVADVGKELRAIQNDRGGVSIGVELDTKALGVTLKGLSDGTDQRVRGAAVEVPTEFNFSPDQFRTFAADVQREIARGGIISLAPDISIEEIEQQVAEVSRVFVESQKEVSTVSEDGIRRFIDGISVAVQDGLLVFTPQLRELERGLEVPVRFNADPSSSGDFPFPLPGETDPNLRIEVPIGFQVDAKQFDDVGAALQEALDAGVISFTDGSEINSIAEAILVSTAQIPDELGQTLDRAFLSGPIVEVENAVTGAKDAIVDYAVTTRGEVTTITPVLASAREEADKLVQALGRQVAIPIVEATSDGIKVTERFVTTQQEAANALGVGSISAEKWAAALEKGRLGLEGSSKAIVEAIQESARLAVVNAKLLDGEEKQIATLRARALAEEGALARRVASGRQTVASAAKELRSLRTLTAGREEDIRAAAEQARLAENPPDRIVDQDKIDRGRESLAAYASQFVVFSVNAVQAAKDFEEFSSRTRTTEFGFDLATPFQAELRKIETLTKARIENVQELVAQGLLSEESGRAESDAARLVAASLRDRAKASEEARVAELARSSQTAVALATYETQRLQIAGISNELDREIALLNADTEEQVRNVEARKTAATVQLQEIERKRVLGELSAEDARIQTEATNAIIQQYERQSEALRKIAELRRADIELEVQQRQALEGDDPLAGFEARAQQILETFKGGQLGAGVADTIFGSLGDAADAFGAQLAGVEGAWTSFRDTAVRSITQIIVKALVLAAIQKALGGFGFGGGASVPGVGATGPEPLIGGGGSGLPDKMDYYAKGGVHQGKLLGHVPLGPGGSAIPSMAYASGGIARSPQLAIFGEKPGSAEAFVPLPDGKNIPVVIQERGGSEGFGLSAAAMQANVSIQVNALDPSSATEAIMANLSQIRDGLSESLQTGTDRNFAISTGRSGGRRR